MIGWLHGRVASAGRSPVVIDVAGVGYEVHVTAPWATLLRRDDECELWIRTIVRADAIVLYGFASQAEREAFDALIGVSGVGPQLALGILGGIEGDELWTAIATEDLGRLTTIAGVGPKTAKRVVLELAPTAKRLAPVAGVPMSQEVSALRTALGELGFRPGEIDAVVRRCPSDLDFEAQVRWALKELAR